MVLRIFSKSFGTKYPELDGRIRDTYAQSSTRSNLRNLYDSYIRAIRWASDRIGKSGIIGFVTNAGFLDSNTADGLRKCLAEEFSSIFVFHLRGNARTSGEPRRREKDNVFGQGTRTPIAITLLVKNPNAKENGHIQWHDIGDYLNQADKLSVINRFQSVKGITAVNGWRVIAPDGHNDWVNQRDDSFGQYISMGSKAEKSGTVFEVYSLGLTTNRDAWCYASSPRVLERNTRS